MKKKCFQPGNKIIVSASEFIKQYEENPGSIQKSVIIPPVIGKPGYGKIFVALNLRERIFPPDHNANLKK